MRCVQVVTLVILVYLFVLCICTGSGVSRDQDREMCTLLLLYVKFVWVIQIIFPVLINTIRQIRDYVFFSSTLVISFLNCNYWMRSIWPLYKCFLKNPKISYNYCSPMLKYYYIYIYIIILCIIYLKPLVSISLPTPNIVVQLGCIYFF